ncbi:MAG TPA: hypothetical protein VN698_10655 [Bacteroidia bacterium]|nr:hypothetical protein [Bacteroidia bacterium]
MNPIYTICIFVFVSAHLIAQTVSSGVYLTINDYKSNKLAEEVECKKTSKEVFKKHDFFAKSSFVVVNKGVKTTYLKKDIYAYRDCENRVWRFYKNHEYEILEAKKIYVYALDKIVLNGIAVEKDPIYYFSDGANGEIKKLTTSNLKAAYPNNQRLYSLLDAYVKTNEGLKGFDATRNTYIVNYLYGEAIK